MTTTTRKAKHVSFEFGEPVSREELEAAGVPLPPDDDLIPVHYTSIRIDELSALRADRDSEQRWANEYHQQAEALEAENLRLLDEHQRLSLTIYELEREKQRLELELLAAKNALMMAGIERAG